MVQSRYDSLGDRGAESDKEVQSLFAFIFRFISICIATIESVSLHLYLFPFYFE